MVSSSSSKAVLSSLEACLTSPPSDYAPVPWWAWTGSLEPDALRRQLRLMHEQGLRQFFIFPIYGMDVEFMSSTYVERIGQVIDWCKELDMRIWVYDELSWPSGTAAGLLARRHPDAVAAQVHLEEIEAPVGGVAALLQDPSVIAVFEHTSEGGRRRLARDGSVSACGPLAVFRRKRDTTVNLTVTGCLWTRNEPGSLDLLSPSAVRAFLEEAYEPIARAFADELGKTILGFFTDEPQFAPGIIPWTDGLPERFRERFGYDLPENLDGLVYETPGYPGVRTDYWSLVAAMASEAYTAQIAAWCDRHGLLLTGHQIYEENSYSVWFCGDIPSHLMKMQVPGCDLLTDVTSFDEPRSWYEFGGVSLVKTPKNPSSAARFSGRGRVMCEAYGVLPWSKTPAVEKRVTDWLAALGVNLINDNSLVVEITDFRKRAISGKHFTQPYWPDEHLYYEYASRVCALSAATVLDTELLLLYPSTTWWAGVRGGSAPSPRLRALEIAFDQTADALVRTHWDFEFLYEQVLAEAELAGDTLVTCGGIFRAVVLGGVSRLRAAQGARLEAFAAAGGLVILAGSDVVVQDDGADRPLRLPETCPRLDPSSASFRSDLNTALSGRLHRTWVVGGSEADGAITAARIGQGDRRLLFVANMTPGAKDLDVAWSPRTHVECWDPDTGARWTPDQADGSLSLRLPQDQSVWLVQTADAVDAVQGPAHFLSTQSVVSELSGPWSFSTDRPNTYGLAFRVLPDRQGASTFEQALQQQDWVEAVHGDVGFPLRPEEMPYYWVRAEFVVESRIPDLEVVVDNELVERAWLNGEPLGSSCTACVWDENNRSWPLADARPAANQLLFRVRTSPYSREGIAIFPTSIVEPLVLRGGFAIGAGGELVAPPQLLSPGDWGTQGYPHFAGVGTYRRRFEWEGGDALFLVEAGASVAEVLVDGASLGKRAWGPKQFLCPGLEAGVHEAAIRVTSTLGGILRRYYGGGTVSDIPPYGLLAPVRIARV